MITVGYSIPICLPCSIKHRTSLACPQHSIYMVYTIPQLRNCYLWYTCQYYNYARIVLELCNVQVHTMVEIAQCLFTFKKNVQFYMQWKKIYPTTDYGHPENVFFSNPKRLGLGRHFGLNSFVALIPWSLKKSCIPYYTYVWF